MIEYGAGGPNKTFNLDVARGKIPGFSFIEKFGENPSLNTADGFEPVWDGGTSYTVPTQARVHNIVSNDVADVGTELSSGTATGGSNTILIDTGATFQTDLVAAGDFVLNDTDCSLGRVLTVDSETQITVTRMASPDNGLAKGANDSGDSYRVVTDAGAGASILYIRGLNAFFLEIQEFIILNGTTSVSTVNSYIRQYRGRVFLAGSSDGAIGTITSTAQTDGTVTLQIINGNNQTLSAIYTVPVNMKGYIYKWWGSLSKKQTAVSVLRLRTGELGGITYITHNRSVDSGSAPNFEYTFPIPLVLPGGADIFIEANTDTNATAIAGGFSILLEEV